MNMLTQTWKAELVSLSTRFAIERKYKLKKDEENIMEKYFSDELEKEFPNFKIFNIERVK